MSEEELVGAAARHREYAERQQRIAARESTLDRTGTVEVSLSGAQGEPGPMGPQGPKGDKGDQGEPGLDALESYVDLGDKSGNFTVDYAAGRWQRFRLTGNAVITAIDNVPTGPVVSALFLVIQQDGTGNRAVSLPAGTKYPMASTLLQLSSSANVVDIVQVTFINGIRYAVVGGWGFV